MPKQATNSVRAHFEGKAPSVRKTYLALLQATRGFGPVKEDPKKTSIHLVRGTAFAGVATRKGHMILTLKSDRPLRNLRVHRTERASPRRFYHEIKLASPGDVDTELIRWLEAAYALSA